MSKLYRLLAAFFGGVLVLAAVAMPADAARPQPHPVRHAAVTATTGCTTTVTDTTPNFGTGWYWETTHTVCNTPDNQSDCFKVDKVNPAAVPPVVNVMPKQCIYPRLR